MQEVSLKGMKLINMLLSLQAIHQVIDRAEAEGERSVKFKFKYALEKTTKSLTDDFKIIKDEAAKRLKLYLDSVKEVTEELKKAVGEDGRKEAFAGEGMFHIFAAVSVPAIALKEEFADSELGKQYKKDLKNLEEVEHKDLIKGVGDFLKNECTVETSVYKVPLDLCPDLIPCGTIDHIAPMIIE